MDPSFFLFMAKDTFLYLVGQSLIGAAAGIYWPAAEIAVPYLCQPCSTPKAYALVRTSEAIGVGTTNLRKMVKDGKIPSYKEGKKIMIPVKALEDWINQRIQ